MQDYGIEKDHVLCIVTDNASNMLSMIKQLNERPKEGSNTTEECAVEIQEEQPGSSSHSSQPIDWNDITEEEENLNFFEGFEEVLCNIDEFAEVAACTSEIEHQRCCVHTLQLAVRDALKEKQAFQQPYSQGQKRCYCSKNTKTLCHS